MFGHKMHRCPTLGIIGEDHVHINVVIKEETRFLFVIFGDIVNQLLVIPELGDMLLLLIFLYDLSANLALG